MDLEADHAPVGAGRDRLGIGEQAPPEAAPPDTAVDCNRIEPGDGRSLAQEDKMIADDGRLAAAPLGSDAETRARSPDQAAEAPPRHAVGGKRPRLEGVQAVKVDANGVSNFHARHREIERLG